jgi:eukaryotic-like serine/threonine-protein kinase
MLSPNSGPAWASGALLADTYLLGRLMRRGGMSEIYEATHARLPGRYAVKILAPELAGNREAFARFCREAEIMSELRHPNLVQIFDFNTAPDQRPYFVMEYLEGRDLETRLASPEPLPLPTTVRLVEAVASALAAAHAHGIVHRDLKPANIFLVAVDGQPDELVKVLDFGISKLRAATTLVSVPGDVMGSPPYMSPEQVRGATELVDERADQFALGAIAYRMLTGHDAFVGPGVAALLNQIVNEPPLPLARHLPVAWDARPLQAVIDRAMAKDPAERWGGMMELARAFEAAAERTLSAPSRETPIRAAETTEPPPVRAAPDRPSVPESRPLPAPIEVGARQPETSYLEDERPGRLDKIPVTHHRAAALGTVALIVAGVAFGTGWYRKIPAAVPRIRQSLAAWLPPKPLAPPEPFPRPEPVAQPASAPVGSTPPGSAQAASAQPPAPATVAPAVVASQSAPAQPDPSIQPLAHPPTPAADAPKADAVAPPRRPHRAAAEPRFRGHPGSIELTPQGPADPAASPTAAAPSGFAIAPPAALPDTPARDLAPATEPPTSPPPPSSDDAPLAPSVP